MKEKYLRLYEEMLNETNPKGLDRSYLPEWIEHCFCVSVRTGVRLKEMLDAERFSGEEEEQWFFRKLQPDFGGLVEYFTLVYTAELYIPQDPDKRMEYWSRELGKTWNFLMRHEKFYLSYVRGATGDIPEYKDNPASYGALAAKIVAGERYMVYIQDKQAGLRHRRQNFIFMRA